MSDRAVHKEKHHKDESTATSTNHLDQKLDGSLKPTENVSSDTFLKRYKILEKIGEGSYSEVLKCQNRKDAMVVACKRLKHHYKSWSDVNNIAEIATLRTIQKHNNILQLIEIHYDETLGKVSLVFELMDINLYELIRDRKRLLPESRVRTIMFQLFRALRHLHKLGIFHRDIKPENILIKTQTDQLKLGDLGSVRGMFSKPPYTEYISTRWYRSPECLLTAGHYSHKMDVWAAGCVFYEVLTLRPLFPGSSEIDQINRINNILGPPPLKLLETFHKQAAMERDSYRGQTQLNRRQQIQKVLDGYSSRYIVSHDSKNSAHKSMKSHTIEYHFAGREGSGLDRMLANHISREAKEIIKCCLSYDPEPRPSATRIIQLPYFNELRESYSRNPEKVSTKPVLTICGENVTEHCGTINLGTLGDHKTRYRHGHPLRTSQVSANHSKPSSKLASYPPESNNKKPESSIRTTPRHVNNSGSNNSNNDTSTQSPSPKEKSISTSREVRKAGSIADVNNNPSTGTEGRRRYPTISKTNMQSNFSTPDTLERSPPVAPGGKMEQMKEASGTIKPKDNSYRDLSPERPSESSHMSYASRSNLRKPSMIPTSTANTADKNTQRSGSVEEKSQSVSHGARKLGSIVDINNNHQSVDIDDGHRYSNLSKSHNNFSASGSVEGKPPIAPASKLVQRQPSVTCKSKYRPHGEISPERPSESPQMSYASRFNNSRKPCMIPTSTNTTDKNTPSFWNTKEKTITSSREVRRTGSILDASNKLINDNYEGRRYSSSLSKSSMHNNFSTSGNLERSPPMASASRVTQKQASTSTKSKYNSCRDLSPEGVSESNQMSYASRFNSRKPSMIPTSTTSNDKKMQSIWSAKEKLINISREVRKTGSIADVNNNLSPGNDEPRRYSNLSRSTIQHNFSTSGTLDRSSPMAPVERVTVAQKQAITTNKPKYNSCRDLSPKRTTESMSYANRYNARKASMIPTSTTTDKNLQRSCRQDVDFNNNNKVLVHKSEDITKRELKDTSRRRAERMRMRDDVFCSSDDDVVISMRKKFDSLISQRAKQLTESLKSNNVVNKFEEARRGWESEDYHRSSKTTSRTHRGGASDKSKKYARRELRAKMAECLTMNNFSQHNQHKWCMPEVDLTQLGNVPEINNSCNGDFTYKRRNNVGVGTIPNYVPEEIEKPSFQETAFVLRSFKNNFQERYQQQHPPMSRIYSFSRPDQPQQRSGRIFTPPGNTKPQYQIPQVGSLLQDRKLKYSHNLPVPTSNTGNYRYSRNQKHGLKQRH